MTTINTLEASQEFQAATMQQYRNSVIKDRETNVYNNGSVAAQNGFTEKNISSTGYYMAWGTKSNQVRFNAGRE